MILHITTPSAWQAAQNEGEYKAASLATEGFIHSSTPAQVLAVANRHFKGQRGLIILKVDETRVRAPIKFESAHGELYPHIYGALNLDAVVGVVTLPTASDGSFTPPDV